MCLYIIKLLGKKGRGRGREEGKKGRGREEGREGEGKSEGKRGREWKEKGRQE